MRLVSAGKGDGQDIEASDAVKMSDFGRPGAPSGTDGIGRRRAAVTAEFESGGVLLAARPRRTTRI